MHQWPRLTHDILDLILSQIAYFELAIWQKLRLRKPARTRVDPKWPNLAGVRTHHSSSSYIESTYTRVKNMLPVIPQELSDTILDFLHNDAASLCSAGLVCKSWLPASRFHLFSDIQLLSTQFRGMLDAICAERSTIPPYIRHLSILGDADGQFVEETLLKLPLLSNLKNLRLMQINMASLTPDAKKRLTTMLQNLTTLHLYIFTVRNWFSFYDSFSSYLRYWNSSKPFIKRLILLRPHPVWKILSVGVLAAMKTVVILPRQLLHPWAWGRSAWSQIHSQIKSWTGFVAAILYPVSIHW